MTTETLTKCYQDKTASICPSNVLTLATNISWLGFPFRPDSKFIFPRHHVAATDSSNLHPMIHLGGRSFLATSNTIVQMSTGPVRTSPLAVYHLPCNVSFVGMTTGLGYCPDHISVSVPLSSATSLEFVPWESATTNLVDLSLNHPILDIPEPEHFNKSVLRELDATLATLHGQLTASVSAVNADILTIHAGTTLSSTDYVAYLALSFSLLNCTTWFIICCLYRKYDLQRPVTQLRCRCGKLRSTTSARNPGPPGLVQEERLHEETLERGSSEERLRSGLHHQ